MSDLVLPKDIHVADPELIARLNQLADIRAKAAAGDWIGAYSDLRDYAGNPGPTGTESEAMAGIKSAINELADLGRFNEAMTLWLPRPMWEGRPAHVERLCQAHAHYDKNIWIGGAGLGKSITTAYLYAFEWWRDPCDTTVVISSVNATNLRGNLFAKMVVANQSCLFPIERTVQTTMMTIVPDVPEDDLRPDVGIRAVLLGRGETGAGRMKGWHTQPFRPEEHPIWGSLTRLFILLDEGQHLYDELDDDLASPLKSIDSERHTAKFMITANPVSETKWGVKKATPPNGWREEDADHLYQWEAKGGWHVERLDARKFENVVQRREVYQGFVQFGNDEEDRPNNQPTRKWWSMWAGWVPPTRTADVVVPSSWFDQAVGEPIYTGPVERFLSVDPNAWANRDSAILAIGRYGLASGYRDRDGKEQKFPSRTVSGEFENRRCLVVDQLIDLVSKDPAAMGKEVKDWATKSTVLPENGIGDKTGGNGVIPWLQNNWGASFYGVNWKNSPNDIKILADDREPASIYCKNIIAEMWWTIRKWIAPNVKAFFINPICKYEKLRQQLTTRGYVQNNKNIVEVDEKEKYRIEHGDESPDEADAVAMLTMIVRVRNRHLPFESVEPLSVRAGASAKMVINKQGSAVRRPGLVGLREGSRESRLRLGRSVDSGLSVRLKL